MESVVVAREKALRELREKRVFYQETHPTILSRVSGPGHTPGPLSPFGTECCPGALTVLIRTYAEFPWEQGQDTVQVTGRKTPRRVPPAAVKSACSRIMLGCCSRVKGLWCCMAPMERDMTLRWKLFLPVAKSQKKSLCL